MQVGVGGETQRTVDVNAYRLYTLRSSKRFADARLDLRMSPGVEAYAFTFG